MFSQERLHYFFLYISCAAVLFLSGLIVCYLLPSGSYFFQTLENAVYNTTVSFCKINPSSLITSYAQEFKFFLFISAATFCIHRHIIFYIITAYKSFTSGLCTACFLKAVKHNVIVLNFETLGCFTFTLLTVLSIVLLCLFCAHSMLYSKRIVYPVKISFLIKRKDISRYIIDFFAVCGIVLIILLLKQGNLYLTVSTKGL